MLKPKFKLNIDHCIILCDSKRVKAGLVPFKDKMKLANHIANELETEHPYQMLYRAETRGFYTRNEVLIQVLLKHLQVTEKQLITAVCKNN